MNYLHFLKAKSFKFTSLFLISLIISFSVSAQTDNPYTRLWKIAKGEKVLSGSLNHDERYTSSPESRKNDKWWIGGFWMKEKNKTYLSTEEVNKTVHPYQGSFTVQGPGVLALYSQVTGWDGGPKVVISEKKSDKVVSPYKIRLYWNKKKNRWVKKYSHKNLHRPIQPEAIFKGPFHKIKEGERDTFEVSINSRDWNNFPGSGEWAYPSPQGIDYEIWYFPLKNGKVISTNPITPKIEEPREDSKYAGYIMAIMGKKDGSIQRLEHVNDKKGKKLKKGDKVYFDDILVANDVMVKIILDSYEDEPLVMMKANTKVQIEYVKREPKGGIRSFLVFMGKLFFRDQGVDKDGYRIILSNAAVGVEGTMFDVEYNQELKKTTINLFEGKLNIKCTEEGSKPFSIEGKNQVIIKQNCNYSITGLNSSNNTPQHAGWPVNSNTNKPATTTFFEDFSNGFTNFSVDDPKPTLENGKLMWKTAYFRNTTFNWDLPIENVAVEFDGYCAKNGFNVYLRNEKDLGYEIILGGWGNKQSGSQFGKKGANRKLVDGKVWNPKQWHHYKIVRKGDNMAAYCDGVLIFQRNIPEHFEGPAKLWFNSHNSPVGLDNVKVYNVQ